jgi:hypothetical protein
LFGFPLLVSVVLYLRVTTNEHYMAIPLEYYELGEDYELYADYMDQLSPLPTPLELPPLEEEDGSAAG